MRYSGAGVLDDWKAIAAILASLVAMVGGAFGGVTKLRAFVRERRTGFDVRADSSSFVVGQGEAATVHIYGRLRLRAHARGSALSNVQARLVSSDPALTLGGCVRVHQREFYLAFRTAHDHMAAMPLSPGEARYVDIVRVRARDPAQATLMLADTPSSPSEGYVLLPGHYTLGVRVTAVETRARELEVIIDFSREWDGTEENGSNALALDVKERPGPAPDPPLEKTSGENASETSPSRLTAAGRPPGITGALKDALKAGD